MEPDVLGAVDKLIELYPTKISVDSTFPYLRGVFVPTRCVKPKSQERLTRLLHHHKEATQGFRPSRALTGINKELLNAPLIKGTSLTLRRILLDITSEQPGAKWTVHPLLFQNVYVAETGSVLAVCHREHITKVTNTLPHLLVIIEQYAEQLLVE
jgi:hypothetical protein